MRVLALTLLVVLVGFLSVACRPAQLKDAPRADGLLYSVRCEAWLRYTTDEKIALSVPFVEAPEDRNDLWVVSPTLTGPDTTVDADVLAVWKGEPFSNGRAAPYTVVLTISLEPGEYLFTQVDLGLGDGTHGTWDIGSWHISVEPSGGVPYLKLGRHTKNSSSLDVYLVELTNEASEDVTLLGLDLAEAPIRVIDVRTGVGSSDPKAWPIQVPDTEPRLTLAPGTTRCFEFRLDRGDNVAPGQLGLTFMALKPVVEFEVGGEVSRLYLPEATYYSVLRNEQELQSILEWGGRR